MFVGPLRGPVGFDGWVNPASGSPLRGELHAVKHVRPSARVFLYPMGIHVSILAAGSAGCCEATFSLAEGDAARHVSTIFTPVRDKNINKKVGNLANILYLYR